MTSKKIAVIGAGFVGIVSLACLVEEGGFDPVCFEKTDKPGGTWCYREESEEGVGSIMPTTTLNHSKEMGALSNFPPKKECNNYMRHQELYKYLMDYAASKDVLKYIEYNMNVLSVKRSDNYIKTGEWKIVVKNRISGEISTDVYEGVLVCVGHINRPKMPLYPGQNSFKGEIVHTHSLKGTDSYKNKTVVVVGMGCSGLDAAVECSHVAKQVYLSTRSGAYVINRVGHHGLPSDTIVMRPYLNKLIDVLPYQFVSWLFESVYLDLQFNQKMYAVRPNRCLLSKDPILNDQLGSKLLTGSIIQKQNIQSFTDNGVIFEGDEKVIECEAVIMATGYTWKFPFLEKGIVLHQGGNIDLYKCVFPPHLPHATLAILGFILPFGPGMPSSELQARWVTQIFAGKCKLPSKDLMLQDIKERHETNTLRYGPSDKTSIRVDYMQYCDDIASQFGAKPDLMKILVTDPALFLKIFFGPGVSYKYRLQGPHSWEGAREAIMTCMDRIMWPIAKRKAYEVHESFLKRIIQTFLLLFLP